LVKVSLGDTCSSKKLWYIFKWLIFHSLRTSEVELTLLLLFLLILLLLLQNVVEIGESQFSFVGLGKVEWSVSFSNFQLSFLFFMSQRESILVILNCFVLINESISKY
jgi:hypothetical protein